jgi:hypothetical protein
MDRTWLDTVRLLGLDVVVGVTLGLLVIHWAGGWVRRAVTRPETAHAEPASTAKEGLAWPPGPWRTSH